MFTTYLKKKTRKLHGHHSDLKDTHSQKHVFRKRVINTRMCN